MFRNYNAWHKWNEERKLEPLKRCPCCGGDAWLEDNDYMRPVLDENGYCIDVDISDSSECLVECRSCGLSTPLMENPEAAIAIWNKRVKKEYEK